MGGNLGPTNVWFALRASADGKAEGFPITVLGGECGDCSRRVEEALRDAKGPVDVLDWPCGDHGAPHETGPASPAAGACSRVRRGILSGKIRCDTTLVLCGLASLAA